MKLAFYDDFRLGVVQGNHIVDMPEVVENQSDLKPSELINYIIANFQRYENLIKTSAETGNPIPIANIKFRSPLPKPGKIVCMAINYLEGGPESKIPPINGFLKSSNSVAGDGDTVKLPPANASIFEHEAELGVVIGKTASNVGQSSAYDYVFGYMNVVDISARDLGNPPYDSYFPIKSWSNFAPMGPYLVTRDEISNPQDINVKLWVNNKLNQNFNTSSMAHKIAECIEWVSSITTLDPGDVIATGTNHLDLGPLQDSDIVEMETEGLGRIHFKIIDPLKRGWPRETRAEKAAREGGGN
tara:strand:+ start:1398 stop:2297 length:900 start_codon:yes stop_codon:yes gene_type:complete